MSVEVPLDPEIGPENERQVALEPLLLGRPKPRPGDGQDDLEGAGDDAGVLGGIVEAVKTVPTARGVVALIVAMPVAEHVRTLAVVSVVALTALVVGAVTAVKQALLREKDSDVS